jgi:heme o synthase
VRCHWKEYAKLVKLPIAAFSALSGATGSVVFCRALNPGVFTAFFGILLLAMGACALNEFQDRKLDARMDRTRRRPIPSGEIAPAAAVTIAFSLLVAGFAMLWIVNRPAAAWIGLGAVVLYNGMYTYLKRIWAFAVAPGALIGALPPVLGWTAAGGQPLDAHIISLAFFFFIWQVPHFWLLLFKFGDDYEKAGLPSLTRIFSLRQLASLTFIWMLATSASSLLLPVYSLAASRWGLGFVIAAIWLALEASRLRGNYLRTGSMLPAFRSINIFALLVIGLLVGDALS